MNNAVIVAAARTPIGKFGGSLAKIPASELGAIVIKEVLSREAVRKRLEGIGAVANLSTPDDFRKAIAADIGTFRTVAQKAGIEAK